MSLTATETAAAQPAAVTPAVTRHYDKWDLETLRAGKAVRDAEGVVIEVLDAMLAEAERQHPTGAMATPRPVADDPALVRRSGPGARTWRADPATDAQLRFLASLHRDLGTEAPTPADKKDASRLIDAAKAALAKARREGTTPAPAARPERKATERQVEFLADLLNERAHDLGEIDPAELSAARASTLITELLDAPRAKVAAHGIREGRYAYTTDGGITADHYRVRRDGKIVVWTAGGEWPYNGKLNEGLEWIKANPREAAELFGRLTETCGRCGRDLSDDDSRARGLGPVCAGKTEW
jgi:hypothetical protein